MMKCLFLNGKPAGTNGQTNFTIHNLKPATTYAVNVSFKKEQIATAEIYNKGAAKENIQHS